MSEHNWQSLLAVIALAGLGALAWGLLFWPIPQANAQAMTFILGAIAGALGAPAAGRLGVKPGGPTASDPSAETDAPAPKP